MRDELVGAEELAKAKKQKAAELVFGRQTVQQAADSLGRNFITAGDPLFDKAYVAGIQKVTAEQVRDVARRYFVPQAAQSGHHRAAGRGAEGGREGAAKAVEGEIRMVKLDNGLRVLVKRNAHLPLVNIQAYGVGRIAGRRRGDGRAGRPGGRHARPGHRGAHGQTDRRVFRFDWRADVDERGTVYGVRQRHDAAGRFSRRSGPVRRMFSARRRFPRKSLPRCSGLPWGPSPRGPTIRSRRSASSSATTCPPNRRITWSRAERASRSASLPREDLRAYHAKYFVPNNMIVTVFGDIDPEKALALVKKLFGDLKPEAGFRPASFHRSNAIAQSIVRA